MFIAAGGGLLLVEMFSWYSFQGYFSSGDSQLILRFFLLEGLTLLVLLVGSGVFLKSVAREGRDRDYSSLSKIASDSFSSKSDRRLGIIAGAAYGVFYAFVSSVVVYQPSVNFASTYGVKGVSWAAAGCCGTYGTTPSLTIFIAPDQHIALQIVPLDLFLLVVIPLLVGVNVAIGSFAYRNRPKDREGAWLGGVGALVALFTSCPTCAGYFLAGALGGVGATSIAVALAPLQTLFILVSVPALIVSPLVAAKAVSKAYVGGCSIEGHVLSRPTSTIG